MLSTDNTDSVESCDSNSFARMFGQERPRLWRLVRFRIHAAVRRRIDPDDVLQDIFVEASNRYDVSCGFGGSHARRPGSDAVGRGASAEAEQGPDVTLVTRLSEARCRRIRLAKP